MITEFLLQDRDNNLIGTLIPEDCLTAKRDWQKNGFHTLDLAVPLNHRYTGKLVKGNRIMFKDTDRDKWYEFEIVRENTDAEKQAVYCESSYYDTLSCSIPFVDITGNTPINGLRKLLDTAQPKSRWQAGVSDVPGSFYMQRTRKNLKETISAWANTCGGVISERIEFYNGQIVRYIDILQSVGSDRGRVIYDDREVTQMSVQVPERTNYTMAFGYGKAEAVTDLTAGIEESKPITFADVEWSTAKGDPVDKPKGQTWVALPESYKEQYGILDANGIRQHRCTIWEENGVEVPGNLLQRTYDGLLAGLEDNTEYKIKAADFKSLGYSTQDIREGDTIGVVLSKLNIKLKAEIVRFTPDYLNPENNDFELSNYSKDIIDDMMDDSELVKNVSDRLDSMIRKIFRQSVLDDWNKEIAAESGFLIYGDPRDGLVCLNSPTYEQATKATRMKGGSLQIANQKVDGDWKWTTVLTGDGMIADAIFTGIIMGERMDINLDLSEIRLGDRNPSTGIIENPVFLFNDDVLRIRIGGTDLEGNLSGIHSSIDALNNQIVLKVERGDIINAVNAAKSEIKLTTDQISLNVTEAVRTATGYTDEQLRNTKAEIKLTTDSIAQGVSRVENRVTQIKAQGSNLLRNTGLVKDTSFFTLNDGASRVDCSYGSRPYASPAGIDKHFVFMKTGATADSYVQANPTAVKVLTGQDYSGSCYAYFPNISNIDKGVKFYIRWFNGSMQTIKESSYEIPLLQSEKWQRVFHTEVAPADASYATARVALIRNGSVYVSALCFGPGNIDSGWSPNGEDTNSTIEQVSEQTAQLEIKYNSIESTVTEKVQTAVTTANGYTDTKTRTLQSQITQNAQAITLKVSEDNIGTVIEQNPTSVRIAWNHHTPYIQLEAGRLNVYDGIDTNKFKIMSLGYDGMRLFRKDDAHYIGKIGTNQLASNPQIKGLEFDLDMHGNYMTWASKDTENGLYIMRMTYARSGFENVPAGMSFGTNIDMRGYTINNSNLVKSHGGVVSLGFVLESGNPNRYGWLEVSTNGAGMVGLDAWKSDGRLKSNIAASTSSGLTYLEQLAVRQFNWKADGFHEDFGFIAQELEQVDESLVYKVPQKNDEGVILDEAYQIRTHKLLPPVVKGIQELKKRVDEQQKMLQKLIVHSGVSYTPSTVKAARAIDVVPQYESEIIICKKPEPPEPQPICFRKNEKDEIEFITGDKNDKS